MFVQRAVSRAVLAGVATVAIAAGIAPAMASAPTATDITNDTVRGDAGGKDEFEYRTSDSGWSVTAVKPGAGTKKADLALYQDEANQVKLAESKAKKKAVDFVLVDANDGAGLRDYFPTVSSKGRGSYTVQNDTPSEFFQCPGTYEAQIARGEYVDVVDVILWEQIEWSLSVDGGADAYVFTSIFSDPRSHFQSRSDGVELPVTMQGYSDWHGIVVADPSGDGGSYTVTCG